MFKSFDLTGRRALITGANSGIGRALALGLAAHGADLVLHYLDNAEGAEQLANDIRALGRRADCIAQDLALSGGPDALAASVGAVDVLVLNAGLERRKPWTEVTPADFDLGTKVNLLANVRLLQLFVPAMQERGWGRVLSIGSIQQQRPHLESLVYSSTKTAMLHIVRNLARHAAPHGVTVNNLAPGAIRTAKSDARYEDKAFRERVIRKIPAAREGRPDDLVGAAILLCSDAGAYITGANLFIDGGRTLFDGT
jgi:NAD(P)-dependent dehydrogenase (short-subunit alcohol dehydrogenase family)